MIHIYVADTPRVWCGQLLRIQDMPITEKEVKLFYESDLCPNCLMVLRQTKPAKAKVRAF